MISQGLYDDHLVNKCSLWGHYTITLNINGPLESLRYHLWSIKSHLWSFNDNLRLINDLYGSQNNPFVSGHYFTLDELMITRVHYNITLGV